MKRLNHINDPGCRGRAGERGREMGESGERGEKGRREKRVREKGRGGRKKGEKEKGEQDPMYPLINMHASVWSYVQILSLIMRIGVNKLNQGPASYFIFPSFPSVGLQAVSF